MEEGPPASFYTGQEAILQHERITNMADRSVNEVLKLALNALVRGETALRWEAIAAIKEVLLEERNHE